MKPLAIIAMMLWASASFAAGPGDAHVFCADDNPPYSYMRDGKATGYSVRVVEAAAKEAGLTVSVRVEPWKRCLLRVKQGAYMAALDALPREGYITSRQAISTISYRFYVPEASRFQTANDVRAAQRLTVGLLNDFKVWYRDYNVFSPETEIDILWVPATSDLMQLIEYERIEVTVLPSRLWAMLDPAKGGFRALEPAVGAADFFLLMNPAQTAVRDRLDQALKHLRESGALDTLYMAEDRARLPGVAVSADRNTGSQ